MRAPDRTTVAARGEGRRRLALLAGVALCGAGLALSPAAIELALRGSTDGALRWGPTLFRALLVLQGAALLALAWWRGPRFRFDAAAPAAESSGWFDPPITRAERLAVALICLVALALRLVRLDLDLWLDEVLTLVNYARLDLGRIVSSYPDQNQHMLYSILGHVSLRLFGEHAWSLRLPAVLFGVASIPATFLLARRLGAPLEALATAALMAVSYHHVWFSQNARGYTGLLFCSTLASWLWLEARSRASWRWWLAYALTCFLGIAIHLTMAWVVVAHLLVYVVLLGRRWHAGPRPAPELRWIGPPAAWLLAAVLALQLYALSLPQFLASALHEEGLPSEWQTRGWLLAEVAHKLQIEWAGLALLVAGALAFAGWRDLARRDGEAATILVLPGLICAAAMFALGLNLWPRFFFFSMGFALLVLVRGAIALPRSIAARLSPAFIGRDRGVVAGYALLLLLVAGSATTLPKAYRLPKQDYSGAKELVERERRPDEPVVVAGLAALAYTLHYAPAWIPVDSTAELRAAGAGRTTVWLVYTLPVQLRAWHPELWRAIERDFEIVRVFPGTLGGGELYVCRSREHGTEVAARAPSSA